MTSFPLAHTTMRGPGDIVGALLGHENFVRRMLTPSSEAFLNDLLDLCTKISIEVAKAQLNVLLPFRGGYCNEFGIWAPELNIRSQEDEASLVSPKLYNKFLLPYHVQEVNAFAYSTFHMHSRYVLSVYNWRGFADKSSVKAFEVSLDPRGPMVKDLVGVFCEMNSMRPLVIGSCSDEQAMAIEQYISHFPGSISHRRVDFETISFTKCELGCKIREKGGDSLKG